jgi:hypothetical protein
MSLIEIIFYIILFILGLVLLQKLLSLANIVVAIISTLLLIGVVVYFAQNYFHLSLSLGHLNSYLTEFVKYTTEIIKSAYNLVKESASTIFQH